MIAAALLLAVPQVWTVDASGGGDFFDLPQAVAFAADGDVLRFEPGTYTPTTIRKNLKLVGSSLMPAGAVTIRSGLGGLVVDGQLATDVMETTLAHLTIERLTLRGLDGRVRVDDCAGADWLVDACDDVIMTRSDLRAEATGFALTVSDSLLSFQDGRLSGGTHPVSGEGGTALATLGLVDLQLIGSDVLGGDAGTSSFGSPNPGPAVAVSSGTTQLVVRGSTEDVLRGGASATSSAPSLKVWAGALEVQWSGATVVDAPVPAVVPAEPYLELGSEGTLGGARRLNAFGPVGAPCYVALAVGSRVITPSPYGGDPVRLDLGQQVLGMLLTLQGQDTPTVVSFQPPAGPALVGFVADVQGLVAEPNGALFVTNATQLVLTD